MTDKSAASHAAPRSTRTSQPGYERDTLQSIDLIFLHDQLEALLASPNLAGVAARKDEGSETPAEHDSLWERDTEPGVDAQLLRAALAKGLK